VAFEEVESVGTIVVVVGASVDALSVASPHATTDAVMSNAATTRRIELFTLAAIVIG
jgi:hypothetical protein